MDVESFVNRTCLLLEKERDAELEENRVLQENVSTRELVRRGVCLIKLRIGEQKTGLYGRTVLKLQPYWEGKELTTHNFTPGDIAGLSLCQGDGPSEMLASGIVSRVTQQSVSVAFDDSQDSLELDDTQKFKITKLANDVTYKRLKQALQNLNGYRAGPSSLLINVLFKVSEPSIPLSLQQDGNQIEFFNKQLDASQQEAVRFAMCQRELAIIHGPPGTGKTTTVVEIIMQAVKHKLKVLTCAPSNIAVDNLVERVAVYGKKVVRLGHPARLLPAIQKYALDAVIAGSDDTRLVEDVRKDIDKNLVKLKKVRNKGERQQLREELKKLRKELKQREQDTIKRILNRADVVMATLTGATDDGPLKWLEKEHFDVVIIDECSQALEAACWIALLKAPKCVIAGDHNQLPPTILSHKAAKEGLEVTLMERQLKLYGDLVMRMLTVQYRMNEMIMTWSSQQLYGGRLTAHQSVATHLLCDLAGVESNEDTTVPMILIDTADCYLNELDISDEMSKGNEGEADLVSHHVTRLIGSGLNAEQIAVIAPYNLQVDFLRLRLSQKYPALEIKSVDGFQGREKEAVIISMVRSNDKGEVGFLAEDRRINVAITRARRHLVVVCDSDTVSHHSFLKVLIEYMMEHGEVRSAQQYIDDGALNNEYQRPVYLDERLEEAQSRSHVKSKKTPSDKASQTKNKSKSERKKVDKGTDGTVKKPEALQQGSDNQNEASDDSMRESLKNLMEDFIADGSASRHVFPPTLTSKERFMVHELAEVLGLLHVSEGSGKDRHITVKKPLAEEKPAQSTHLLKSNIKPTMESADDSTEKTSSLKLDGDAKSTSKTEDKDLPVTGQNVCDRNTTVCGICGKDIPKGNIELHRIQCTRLQHQQKDQPTAVKPKKKKKAAKSAKKEEKEEDFDALMEEATRLNTVCNFTKCRAYTTTVGQLCPFCRKCFCLTHHMPEVHGCGAEAKAHARAVINREGVLYRGSGVPDKTINPNKKAHLQRKLEKKLNEMSDGRKVKKKGKD